jgi:hypothetical protein
VTLDSLTCSARIVLQADAVRPARTMVRETPASLRNPSTGGRGERRAERGLSATFRILNKVSPGCHSRAARAHPRRTDHP